MPKQSRTPKPVTRHPRSRKVQGAAIPERDENQIAYDLVRQIEELGARPDGKDPLAVALGRRGGLRGGRARADKLSKEELIASARKAARVRWGL